MGILLPLGTCFGLIQHCPETLPMEPDTPGDSAGISAFAGTTGRLLESGFALAAFGGGALAVVDPAGAFAFEISLDAAFGGGV